MSAIGNDFLEGDGSGRGVPLDERLCGYPISNLESAFGCSSLRGPEDRSADEPRVLSNLEQHEDGAVARADLVKDVPARRIQKHRSHRLDGWSLCGEVEGVAVLHRPQSLHHPALAAAPQSG